jgi:TIR domain
VFLSYRRRDSGPWMDRLQERLELRFGEDLVFRDLDDLRVGGDFLSQIRAGIRSADAVLILIGPRWLDGGRHGGRARLHRRGDVLRREIEWALSSRKGAVVPVLVGGASMPDQEALPASIRSLRAQQARSLGDASWDADCSALFEGLRRVLRRVRRPEPLEGLHRKLVEREERYFALLPADPARARELAQATLRLLDRQSPFYPHDSFLQVCRGYAHKNIAMALRDDPRTRRKSRTVHDALNRSEAVFSSIRREAAERLAEGLNGFGSVAAVRGDLRAALEWIDQALALVPDYPAALSDREQVMAALRAGRSGRSRRQPVR